MDKTNKKQSTEGNKKVSANNLKGRAEVSKLPALPKANPRAFKDPVVEKKKPEPVPKRKEVDSEVYVEKDDLRDKKRKLMKYVVSSIMLDRKDNGDVKHSKAKGVGDDSLMGIFTEEDDVKSDVSEEATGDEFDDHDEEGKFGRPATLRVSRRKGTYRVRFQPIRLDPGQQPLLPLEFVIPDAWSDDEGHPSDSDLDIEYIAPAAFMDQQVKRKPLTQVMKQMYDYAEVEKHFEELGNGRVDEKERKMSSKS